MALPCPIFKELVGVDELCAGAEWVDFTDPNLWQGVICVAGLTGGPCATTDGWSGSEASPAMSTQKLPYAAWDGGAYQVIERLSDDFGELWCGFKPKTSWSAGFRPTKVRITYQVVDETSDTGKVPPGYQFGTIRRYMTQSYKAKLVVDNKAGGFYFGGFEPDFTNLHLCDRWRGGGGGSGIGNFSDFPTYYCNGAAAHAAGIHGFATRGDWGLSPHPNVSWDDNVYQGGLFGGYGESIKPQTPGGDGCPGEAALDPYLRSKARIVVGSGSNS